MKLLFSTVLVALLVAACGETLQPYGTDAEDVEIEMHRSPDCSCCEVYEDYLIAEGFEVRTVLYPEGVVSFRETAGVPDQLASCHTSMVGGYFVEGHVPVDDIRRLLSEAPDLSGIALPGMPPGSPGMGGTAEEPLVIYAVEEGEIWVFSDR